MSGPFKAWIWRMAWRDARRNIGKILLALSCVIMAVASVVSVMTFRENVATSTREQSKALLGADLAIDGREPFTPEAEALIGSVGGAQSREIGFSSMAFFPDSGVSRLVQVRALSGDFPYYGKLETDPPGARDQVRSGIYAVADETMMLQLNVRVGERVRIGEQEFPIAGKLVKIPGESLAFSLIQPRVYVPLAELDRTPLLQKGSLVRYRVFFRLPAGTDVDQLVQRISPQLEQLRLRADTVKRRAAVISGNVENLSRYLALAVFIAVLLASIGVASGVHVYTKEKSSVIALLRCIGAKPAETVWLYIIQVLIVGLAGSLVGALLGLGLQTLLPLALEDFLPVTVPIAFVPGAVLSGTAVGLGTALLFALLPLLSLRKISPLLALRFSYEENRRTRDPARGAILVLIVCVIFAFAQAATARLLHALWFTGAVLIAFALIAGIARGASAIVRKAATDLFPFSWRQGVANLHRPNNQTTAVMLAVGLATFLLVTLYNAQSMLLTQAAERGGKGEPNLVLFDVQRDQRAAVQNVLGSFNVPLYEEVPVVTMRLSAVKGRSADALRADPNRPVPSWALRREYRSTYRSRLGSGEQLIKGAWTGKAVLDGEPVPVSLEKGIAETLGVDVGDRLEFDVQGVALPVEVGSIRAVEWQRVRPNFFVIFPEGVLEQAPQFYALVTRVESSELSARLQRAVIQQFPNVSMIDLTLVLNTLDAILGRITDAVRFVALFTILAAIFVLTAAILSRRSQRTKESILLRMLGARRRQIVNIVAVEYLLLGAISCATGAFLGILASWGLSFYFIGMFSRFSPVPLAITWLVITGATVLLGMLGCWGIFRRPALETLRAET
jgi:putative ABC transport system permease protein